MNHSKLDQLIAQMTLEDKLQQLSHVLLADLPDDEDGINAYFETNSPGFLYLDFKKSAEHNARKFKLCQEALRTRSRLGIEALTGAEAIHGVMLIGSTIYPQSIALGATWNTDLVKEMASQIADEASSVGVNQVLSPVLDLGRDPRYGRIEETYGECPTLVTEMSLAFIKGMQGDDASKELANNKAFAMLKHFAGYSTPANGINLSPVLIGKSELISHHLVPFEAAVKEGHVMSVMPSYNSVDGVPSHSNPWLLTDLLRDEWGFEGYVYSDWCAINYLKGHRVVKDMKEAGLKSLTAGVDLEAPTLDAYKYIPELIEEGKLSIEVVDTALKRMLHAKDVAGLLDGRRKDRSADVAKTVHNPEHVATSRKLAEESIILLKNEGGLLPLNADKLKSIAVIGPNAAQVQFGDYTWSKLNQDGVNVLEGLEQALEGKAEINYGPGCDLVGLSKDGFQEAVDAAQRSDVAVVVIGDTSAIFAGVGWEDPTVPYYGTVGEGYDVANPVPPGVQEDLVKAIVATGKPVVLVLLNGRPYCMPWIKENVTAIVEAFYPGEQQGHAIADILLGKACPSGRLPVTLAPSVGHIPCTYDFKGYGRGFYRKSGKPGEPGRDYVFDSPEPLWPFGFGLTYTAFEYSALKLVKTQIQSKDDFLKLSFKVKNTGNLKGKVVAQIYWRLLCGHVAPPEKRLLRFTKVELAPGEEKTLQYEVPVHEFRQIDLENRWVVDPATIEIQVGDNAEEICMKAMFEIA